MKIGNRSKIFDRIKNIDKVINIGTVIYNTNALPMLAIEKNLSAAVKIVLILSSEHGDEPAGVYANLKFLEEFKINKYKKIGVISIPLVDPHGFVNDSHTNPDGVEIYSTFGDNPSTQEAKIISKYLKDKNIDLGISLHEDSEIGETYPNGFYVIECPRATGLSRLVADKVAQKYRRTDAEKLWGGRRHDDGVVVWNPNNKSTDLFPTLLKRNQVKYCLFIETCIFSDPSGKREYDLQHRVSNQIALLNAAISFIAEN